MTIELTPEEEASVLRSRETHQKVGEQAVERYQNLLERKLTDKEREEVIKSQGYVGDTSMFEEYQKAMLKRFPPKPPATKWQKLIWHLKVMKNKIHIGYYDED